MRILDANNKLLNHVIVALISFLLIYVLWSSGIRINRSIAGVTFFLLFLTLIIGPIVQLWRPLLKVLPWDLPWSWRGELGIWFTLLSIVHVLLIFSGREWQIKNLYLSDVIGLVALFLALILVATSLNKVIRFLGVESWRWLHGFAYVIFYLVSAHTINHAFLRSGRPEDWLHWMYLVMMFIVILLQASAFVKIVIYQRKKLKEEQS